MATSADLDCLSVEFSEAGAAAMRDGDEFCGFKSALSLGSGSRSESSCTSIKSCFYDAAETMLPRSEFEPTPTISTSARTPTNDRGPSAYTACMYGDRPTT